MCQKWSNNKQRLDKTLETTHLYNVSLCQLPPWGNPDVITIQLNHGYREKMFDDQKECMMMSIQWIDKMYNGCCAWRQAWVHLNKTNHPWRPQSTNWFPHTSVPCKALATFLTIELSLANSNNDDRHGEFSCLSWTRRTNSQLSPRCLKEHTLYCAFWKQLDIIRHFISVLRGYILLIYILLTIHNTHFPFCKVSINLQAQTSRDRNNTEQDKMRLT